jgi:hypothetical protein
MLQLFEYLCASDQVLKYASSGAKMAYTEKPRTENQSAKSETILME